MNISASVKQGIAAARNRAGLLPLCCVIIFSAHAFGQTAWTGEYFFGEDGGETAGGSIIYVAHTLTISEFEGKLKARFYSQGFQTSFDVFARVVGSENKLDFYFEKYGPDQAIEGLEEGDLILSLVFSDGRLVTNWGKFRPLLDSNAKNGEVRFVKSPEKENEASNWIRVLYAKGDVSIALPDGFIFDDRKSLVTSSLIYAYSGGLNIQVARYSGNVYENKRFRESLEKNDQGIRHIAPYYIVTIPTGVSGSAFAKRIQIIGPEVHLEIILSGHVKRVSETGGIIDGLRIVGKGLNDNEGPVTAREIGVDDLKLSESVTKALKKKRGKIERNISYEIESNNSDSPENPIDTRKAIVLDIPRPSKRDFNPPRIMVQLRADGEIGDMVIYSSRPPKELKKHIEAATKIKFIPAVRNGKNVDSLTTVSFPRTVIIIR